MSKRPTAATAIARIATDRKRRSTNLPPEGDGNSHQRYANADHNQPRRQRLQPSVTSKKDPTYKQRYDRKSVGNAQRQPAVCNHNKRNDDRKCRQDNDDTNAQCTLPVAPRQSGVQIGRRDRVTYFPYQLELRRLKSRSEQRRQLIGDQAVSVFAIGRFT